MKKYPIIITLFAIALVFTPGNAYANTSESAAIYGHISYIEGNPKVIRVDKTQEDAVINLPVAPGDRIVTGDNSRCELQFDNGTVLRLGKNSRLKVTTVLAQSLTSRWKITTLELTKGALYTINQSYNRERFQIITPNAAVHLKNNSKSVIDLRKGGTHIFCDRGKFKVMYGDDADSLKTATIRKGEGYMITAEHALVKDEKRDIDFLSWNQYIDNNFKKLHYGISKIPKKIYRYSKAIVYWAEKWSSLFGEWVYDDLLGYVWKPADERFAYAARPFFHAKFTWVNNELFLVPSQPWGWAPSHLGTWVWMKRGWTWVPGSSNGCGSFWRYYNYPWMWFIGFNPHFGYIHHHFSLGHWVNNVYGDWNLYYTYRNRGYQAWQHAYQQKYQRKVTKPSLKNVPDNVRTIIRKLNKVSVATIKERLGKHTPEITRPVLLTKELMRTPKQKLPVRTISPKPMVKTVKASPISIINKVKRTAQTKQDSKKNAKVYRDWNPDKRWSLQRGVKILYSSKTNEVVCRELGLSSKKITPAIKHTLRTLSARSIREGYNFASPGGSGGTHGSGNSSSSSHSPGSHSSSRGGRGGGVSNSASTNEDNSK